MPRKRYTPEHNPEAAPLWGPELALLLLLVERPPGNARSKIDNLFDLLDRYWGGAALARGH
jgi:hypothetical protein